MTNFKHSAFFCLACIFAAAVPVQAQTSRGTVNGIVTDASGATLPNATVKLTNKDTNQGRSTVTNDSGLYRFDAVDPGTYEVNVTAAGFRATTLRLAWVLLSGRVPFVFLRQHRIVALPCFPCERQGCRGKARGKLVSK